MITSNWSISSVVIVQSWVVLYGHFILRVKFILYRAHVFLRSTWQFLAELRRIFLCSQLGNMWLVLAFPNDLSRYQPIISDDSIGCVSWALAVLLLGFYLNSLWLRWRFGLLPLFFIFNSELRFLIFLLFFILFIEEGEIVWVFLFSVTFLTIGLTLLVNAADYATKAIHIWALVLWSSLLVVADALVACVSAKYAISLPTSRYVVAWVTRSVLVAYSILVANSCGGRGQASLALSGVVVTSVRHHFWIHIFSLTYLRAVF